MAERSSSRSGKTGRGLRNADEQTRKRVAEAGGKARAEQMRSRASQDSGNQ
jgi:hypothetical protein